jgi:hypothetical protein
VFLCVKTLNPITTQQNRMSRFTTYPCQHIPRKLYIPEVDVSQQNFHFSLITTPLQLDSQSRGSTSTHTHTDTLPVTQEYLHEPSHILPWGRPTASGVLLALQVASQRVIKHASRLMLLTVHCLCLHLSSPRIVHWHPLLRHHRRTVWHKVLRGLP